jgi:tetratricopeptide (TPR) repeat protein
MGQEMTMRRLALLALFGSTSWAAHAADKVVYQPVPGWVKPAPAIDTAKITNDSPVLLVLDDQERLADGQVWRYSESVTRLATSDVVQQSGTLTMGWQPAKGDLIIHAVEIVRGGTRIDALAGGKTFTVIRREQQLEQQAIDGALTATMAVEGLQVGDLLRVVSSVTRRETALKGALETSTMMPVKPVQAGFVRTRFLWPAKAEMHWKTYGEGVHSATSMVDGLRELVVTGPLPKPPELPNDAPMRYRVPPIVEAASFADWQAVSRTMAPLYDTAGTIQPGGELARAVTAIAAANQDPLRRASAALQLVQEKVRYLYNGMENGNYVPQTPAQTWALRYGDCKAKSLLLLAILHDLKIDAEPVLASSDMGDLLPSRLASAGAFDHVLVRVTIGNEDYWLDGTGSGARYADIHDTPPLRWVLPLRSAGTTLLAVPLRAPAMPMMAATLDYDHTAGVKLPTLVHAVIRVRGPFAQSLGLAKSQGSKEQKDTLVGGAVGSLAGAAVALTGYTLSYDPAEGEGVISADGFMTTPWQMIDKRYRMVLDRNAAQMTFEPDRARTAWKAIPVSTGVPGAVAITTRLTLPPDLTGFALDGDTSFAKPLGGTVIKRTASIAGRVVTVSDVIAAGGAEIAAADVAAARASIALARSRALRIVAPETPARWSMVTAARRDGRLKPIMAAMTKAIAADPEEAEGYVNRANLYIGTYDWQGALPDLDKAVALDPSVKTLLARADAYRTLGNTAKALADYQAALAVDAMAFGAIEAASEIDVDAGRRDVALARVDERIAAGGEHKADMLALKASLLARAGMKAEALAAIDAAIAEKPGNPQLLNSRCWIKGTLNVALDTALKDCTRAIELSDSGIAAMDSRAMVFFRMNRLEEALADLGAVLDVAPDLPASLYLRGVILARQGKPQAKADLLAARTLRPRIDDDYKRYGITP